MTMLRPIIVLALVAGMLAALVGLFGFNGISAVSAQTDTTAPTISSVAITGDPDENDADLGAYEHGGPGRSSPRSIWASGVYRIGDDVEVTVTFSENVTVTGSPQLELAIGSNNRTAEYDSTDGSAAIFSYTVAEGDSDSDGIAIGANKLTLNGGSIKDAANNDAALSHNALAAQDGYKVDGVRPRLMGVRFLSSSDGSDGAYSAGEELMIIAEFNRDESGQGPIRGSASAKVEFDLEDEEKAAAWDWSLRFNDTREYVAYFAYVVQEGDLDSDGPAISANSVVLNEGFIRDAAGNDAVLTHEAVEAGTHFKVDAVAPTVSSIAITSDPGDDDTYGSGDKIEVTVTFSENMSFPISISCGSDVVHCEAELELDIGGTARTAAYQSHEGAEAIYAYTVQAGDSDDDGIAIGANKLTGQPIRDAAGRLGEGINDADLSHDAVAADSGHKADGGSSSALTVSGDVTITIQENRPTYVASYEVSGRNGYLTWSLTGDDSDDFTISGGLTGRVDFNSSPNFEDPADTDADNEYEFTVNASDDTNDASLHVTVVVTNERHDADELPVITGTAQVGETLTVDTSPIPDTDENTTFGYAWKRTDGDTDTFIDGANGTTSAFTNYTMTADDEGKTIKVAVTFWTTAGERVSLTSVATAAVAAAPPPPPDNVRAVTQKDGTVELTWDAPQDATVTGYRIERSRADENRGGQQRSDGRPRDNHTLVEDTGSADTGYTDNTAQKGVGYEYQVSARNEAGTGEASEWVRAGPESASNSPATGAPVIIGTAQVGETLTAGITGIADADGLSGVAYNYQWLADDTEIDGATGSTYTVQSSDAGKAIKVQVTFTDDAGNEETLTSAATVAVEASPNQVPTGGPIILGMAEVGQPLVVSFWQLYQGIQDGNGLTYPTFSYQWIRSDGTTDSDIPNATNWVYTLTDADEGKNIRVRVSFTDDGANAEALTSSATAAVTARPSTSDLSAPTSLRRQILQGEEKGFELNWNAPERTVTGYQILRMEEPPNSSQWEPLPYGCTPLMEVHVDDTGSDATTYTDTDVAEGAAYTHSVRAVNSDGVGRHTPFSSPFRNTGFQYRPHNWWPSGVPGSPSQAPTNLDSTQIKNGVGLTWDAPEGEVTGYQILRRNPEQCEFGYRVYVENTGSIATRWADRDVVAGTLYEYHIRAINDVGPGRLDTGNSTSLRLSALVVGPEPNNQATGTLTINGAAQVGETLTADRSGIADADGLHWASLSYQWLSSGDTEIEGATGPTYALQASDAGKVLKVRVTFIDDAGYEETLTSEATSAVRLNVRATGAPTITGTVAVGETLTGGTSGIVDSDGFDNASFSYQWIRSGGRTPVNYLGHWSTTYIGSSAELEIDGATSATYTVTAADVDKTIKLRVNFTDDTGNIESLTSSATAVVPLEVAFTFSLDGTTVTCDYYNVHVVNRPKGECEDDRSSIDQGESDELEVEIEITRSASSQLYKFRFRIYMAEDSLGYLKNVEATDLCLGPGLADSVSMEVTPDDETGNFTFTDEGTIFNLCPAGTYQLNVPWYRYNHEDEEYEYAGNFRRFFFINGDDEEDTSIERVKSITPLYPDPPVSHGEVQIQGTKQPEVLNRDLTTFSLSIGGLVPDSDIETTDYVVRLRIIGDNGPYVAAPWCLVGNVGYSYLLKTVPEDGRWEMDAHVQGSCIDHWWPDTLKVELFDGSDLTDYSEPILLYGSHVISHTGVLQYPKYGTHEFIAGTDIALGALPNTPATGAPTIIGTAQVGETLTADTTGIDDSDGLVDVSYDYQWLADDTEIASATGNTYVLTSAELGKAVKVRVSFTDDAGNEESLTSAATDAVAAVPPPPPDNVRAVTQESGAVELTWEAPQDATVTGYRIERSRADENRGGQQRSEGRPRDNHTLVEDTGSADTGYTDKSAEKGVEYEYRVSARNEAGPGEGSDWVRAGPASASNSPANGAPTISGTAQVGQTLTAGISGIADADGLSGETFTYQWVSGDGTTDTDMENATGSTYKLVAADQGRSVKVRVTFTDGGGNEETLTSAPTGAVEEQPVLGDGPPGALRNLAATAGNKEVTLSWDPPADNGNAPATGYRIEWRVDGKDYDKTIWGTAGSTTYTTNVNANLANGVKYFFRVSAGNGSGNSYGPYGPASGEVSATPTSGSAVDLGTPVLSNTENLHHGMVGLDWQDVEDAGWYVVQYYHVEGGEWLDLPAVGVDIAFHGSSAVVSNLHGLSWLRVGAMSCAGASEWSQIEELYGTKESDWEGVPVPEVEEGDEIEPCPVVLGTPVLSDTENLHHGMVRLDWQDIEDAGWYVVQYYHLDGGSGEWVDLPAEGVDIAFHGSSAVVSNLEGLSWLRVGAASCDGTSEWSQIEQLFGTNASDWEGMPVPDVEEGDEIEPCSEDADTPDNSPATGAPTISGTARVGEVLEVDTSGIADADGLSNVQYEYQWLADDSDISGATNNTYTLVAAADEAKAIKVQVSFTDDAGNDETLTSAATDAVAAAQTNSPATGAPTITGTAQVGQTLTADTSGIADADGLRSVQYEYQWLADDAEIADATSSTYTLLAEDEGQVIKVRVSFTDDQGNEESLTSGATDTVAARPNSPATGVPTISGTAQVGETLTANTSGVTDADGLSRVQYEYQWLADAAEIAGATGSTYTLTDSEEGKAIKVEVSFTDDAGNDESLTSAATEAVTAAPAPNNPATGAPTISGTAQVGETLTANTSGVADADGLSNVEYEYQWLADAAEVVGATGSTYTLADVDEGKAIKVEVNFTDDAGNEETMTSAATDAAAAAPTPNSPATGAPTINGTVQVGETLTAGTSGIADEDGLTNATYSFQWLADDAEIAGATNATYTLSAEDEGKAIKVEVTFTDDAGNGEALTSAATDAVAAEPSEPPSKPKGLEATSTHDSVTLTWDDPQDESITGYVILRRVRENDQGGDFSVLVANTGSAATTYTDNEVAAGTTYTYRIKAINGAGTSERSRWVHIDTPAPPVPDKPTGLSATAAHDAITLTWDNPGDDSITGYVILRRNRDDDPKGHFDELVENTGTAAPTHTDDTVAASTNYTYRIKAINEYGVSQRSRWYHISTPAAP